MKWCSIVFLASEVHRSYVIAQRDCSVTYRFSRFFVIDTESLAFDMYKVSFLHIACTSFPDRRSAPAFHCLRVLRMVSYPVTHPVCVKWDLTKTRVTFNRPSSRSKDCRRGSLIGLNKFGRTTCGRRVRVCTHSVLRQHHQHVLQMWGCVLSCECDKTYHLSTQRVEIGRENAVQEFNKFTLVHWEFQLSFAENNLYVWLLARLILWIVMCRNKFYKRFS